MLLQDAKQLASEWIELLRPLCLRVEVAGSVRRGEQAPKDIDIVCMPKPFEMTDLFGETVKLPTAGNPLHEQIKTLVSDHGGTLTLNGQRQKRIHLPGECINIELWIVTPPAQWGVIFLLRTGPSEYAKWIVTSETAGGALPQYLNMRDGGIYMRDQLKETPEEKDVYRLIRLPYAEPNHRHRNYKRNW